MREPRTILSQSPTASGDYYGDGLEDPAARGPIGPIAGMARAAVEGVLPVVILVALLGLFWEASVIGRVFATPYGMDIVQRTEMVTAGGGLIVALIVYLISATRTLQGVREHQKSGAQIEATITLAFLVVSALVTLFPLFMALAAPQHPAP